MILLRNSQRVLEQKMFKQDALPQNLVTNGDFRNGTAGWSGTASTVSASGNTLTDTGDGTGAQIHVKTSSNLSPFPSIGKKYYLRAMARVTNSNAVNLQLHMYCSGTNQVAKIVATPIINIWYNLSGIVTIASDVGATAKPAVYTQYVDAPTSNGKRTELQYVLAIDLTAAYGAGNEPTVAWCDKNLPFRTETGTPERALLDRSRFANNGVFSNVNWVQLPSGTWVMNFNGVDSYVEIPDSPTMRMAEGGTILAWIYARSLGETSKGVIISKGTGTTSAVNGYQLRLSATSQVVFTVNNTAAMSSAAGTITLGKWLMVTIPFIGGSRSIYLDTTDITASVGSAATLPPNIAGNVRVGNSAGSTDLTFDGMIGGLRMFNKVLTQTEIARVFASERWMYGV